MEERHRLKEMFVGGAWVAYGLDGLDGPLLDPYLQPEMCRPLIHWQLKNGHETCGRTHARHS